MIRNEHVYATEFEKIVLSEIERQVSSLPMGAADCYIGPSRHSRTMVSPTFEIQPSNPLAARISGAVLEGQGAVVSVGFSRRELWYRRTSTSEASDCARLMSEICRAVFAGNFTERVKIDRFGRRISSRLNLRLTTGDFQMWQNRLLADILTPTSAREIPYAPYSVDSRAALK